MEQVLLVRFGEVHLKGLNRPYFLRMLVENVRRAVKDVNGHVWMSDSRIYVSGVDDMDACAERVRKVFGIYSVSPAFETEKDYGLIREAALEMMRGREGTFKVLARRSDKRFPVDSMTMDAQIGGDILDAYPSLKVDVHRPDHKLRIEIRDKAYICADEIKAVGGLPMGTSGKAALLLSGGIDSPVAGYQIMKRGVRVCAVHFMSPPYTGELARDKVIQLAKLLADYCGNMRVYMVPFTHCQLEIKEKCPEGLTTLITRRFMMRIASRVAQDFGAQALITGESLGQVASQTMESIQCTDAVASLPVFRPLIGMDKQDIIEQAVRIGTYDTSILPYEDCCTVFTPRHPVTKPKLDRMEQAEARLDADALVEEAVAGTEMMLV